MENELEWRDYGAKHHESIYTRFFQSYILPNKFGIDKRRMHNSNMVQSGQMTREDALRLMGETDYPEELMRKDKDFVIKKFSLTEQSFDDIMNLKKKDFRDYPNNFKLIGLLKHIQTWLRKIKVLHK